MNTRELKAERARLGLSQAETGKIIGKCYNTYAKKERGEIDFTIGEIILLARHFSLSLQQVDLIFFDGRLTMQNKSTEVR